MIRFVMMGSNKKNIREYNNIIDKLMMNENIHYETFIFNNNKDFDEFCKNVHGSLVFIIENDKETNAVDIIEKIRHVYNIYEAFIIIIDKNKQLNLEKVLLKYSFLCEILQTDNLEEKLDLDLQYILNVVYHRQKALTFTYGKCLYKIPFKDILYIEKELNGKKCMIVCKERTYTTYKSIIEIAKDLDERFIKSHQSALININNVKQIDYLNNKILFECNNECNLLSRNMKKELKKILPN